MNTIQVMTDDDTSEQYTDYIKSIANFVLTQENKDDMSCTIISMPQKTIKKYNKMYKNKNYVPDVLSFANDTNSVADVAFDKTADIDDKTHKGDILICQTQIVIQAMDFKVSFIEELARIVIHGILHLLGYTHNSYESTEPMLQRQEILVSSFLSKNSNAINKMHVMDKNEV